MTEPCENCGTGVDYVEWPEPMVLQLSPSDVPRDAWGGPATVEHTPERCREARRQRQETR